MKPIPRCDWCQSNALMMHYHDTEWGVPVHDDRVHFEFLLLDAFQAGLSWQTIINKRDNFRVAFDDFDYDKIADYEEDKVITLLNDPGIIRNKLKVASTIQNARAFISIRQEYGTFDDYIWQFTGFKTLVNSWKVQSEIPASTKESDAMSKSLKKHGFNFVGTTICYAYMQAAGMVNDHLVHCFRYKKIQG